MRGADWVEKDTYKLRSDAKRFEDWEISCELLLGSKAAVEYALTIGLPEIKDRNEILCHSIREKLNQLHLTTLDIGKHLSSIITVKIPGMEPGTVLGYLREKNINSSIATRSSAIIDFDAKGVSWALRISPHYYNTESEVNLLIEALRKMLQ